MSTPPFDREAPPAPRLEDREAPPAPRSIDPGLERAPPPAPILSDPLAETTLADDQVFGVVEAKVVKVVEEIRDAGYPITEFSWSRKERDSLITKLLAKRDSIAARVYDKLRFRLITRRRSDLAGVLRELMHRL